MRLASQLSNISRWRFFPPLALLLILAIGTGLRANRLGFKSLWHDEAIIYWISQGGSSSLLAENASLNSAPPLFPFLVALSSLIGHSEPILRGLPFLAGALSIVAMYALGRRFFSQGAALLCAAILAVSPVQISYAQELREYSLSVLFAILMVLAYEIFVRVPTWRNSAIVAIVVVVGIFTQYGLALLCLALSLVAAIRIILTQIPRRPALVMWVSIQVATLVAAVAIYGLSFRYQWEPGGFAADNYLSEAYWTGNSIASALSFVVTRSKDIVAYSFPGYTFVLLFYAGVVLLVLSPRRWGMTLVIGAPFVVVATAGLAGLYPYHGARQDLFLTPMIYLVVAFALDYLLDNDPKKVLPMLFLGLMASSAIQLLPAYFTSEGQSAAGKVVERLESLVQPGDPIYVCEDDPVFRYYLRVRHVMPANPVVVGIQEVAQGPRDYLDQVDELLADEGRAWMLTTKWCGDMTPLLTHVAREWTVDL